MYDPSIVFVGQGSKRGYLGDEMYQYDAHNYLVLTVPVHCHFERETEAASDGPMLAFSVRIDIGVLHELAMKLNSRNIERFSDERRGMYATPMDECLTSAAIRLLENPSRSWRRKDSRSADNA